MIQPPVFRNKITTQAKRFRYVRYQSSLRSRSPLAEIEFYIAGQPAKGTVLSKGIKFPERSLDGNTYTVPDNIHFGYSVSLDYGTPVQIDSIVFYPKNDDNFVRPDHEFELNYFCDGHWIPLECTSRQAYSLTYNNIPRNSLLLLRDLTAGKEERPFILRNGKVEWW